MPLCSPSPSFLLSGFNTDNCKQEESRTPQSLQIPQHHLPPPVDPYYGIPLEQRPPRILAPLPRQPIPLNNFTRVAESEAGGTSESTPSEMTNRRPPTPPRRRTLIIVISPSTTAENSPDAPRSPTPGKYAHYRDNGRGFDVGR